MAALRTETDAATAKHEEASARVKQLEQENTQKEQEISSLTHRNGLLEAEVEKLEQQVKELKSLADDESGARVRSLYFGIGRLMIRTTANH
jgi:tropomyosin